MVFAFSQVALHPTWRFARAGPKHQSGRAASLGHEGQGSLASSKTRTLRGGNAMAVIATLNPLVRGWAAYYRGVVSSRLFGSLDHYLWHITYK